MLVVRRPAIAHLAVAPSCCWRRRRSNPVRMRVFAVPSGMPSRRLISSAVHPPNTARTTARAWSLGSARSRSITRPASTWSVAASPVTSATSPPSVACSSRSSSSPSAGTDRRARTASIAALRVIVSSHAGDGAAHRVVGRRRAPRPHERLLGDIVGERRIVGDRQRQAVHLRLEPADERRRRVGILDGQPGDQRVVGELGVVWCPHVGTTTAGGAADCAQSPIRAFARSNGCSSLPHPVNGGPVTRTSSRTALAVVALLTARQRMWRR